MRAQLSRLSPLLAAGGLLLLLVAAVHLFAGCHPQPGLAPFHGGRCP